MAVFCSWPPRASFAQTVCAAASVKPSSVAAGTSATMTVVTNGTIDLGNVTTKQFGVRPSAFACNYKIINQIPQSLVFSMDVASTAEPGVWTLFVNDASGHEVVALNLTITSSVKPPPKCNAPSATCPCHLKGEICVEGCCISGE